MEKETEEEIVNRFKRIEGQIRGLERLVENGAPCLDILTQVSAVTAAVKKAGAEVIRISLEQCLSGGLDKTENGPKGKKERISEGPFPVYRHGLIKEGGKEGMETKLNMNRRRFLKSATAAAVIGTAGVLNVPRKAEAGEGKLATLIDLTPVQRLRRPGDPGLRVRLQKDKDGKLPRTGGPDPGPLSHPQGRGLVEEEGGR